MKLRQSLAALSDEHQRLLVEAAFHALNDVQFSAEVANLAGVSHESLAAEDGFSNQVVAPLFDAARAESDIQKQAAQAHIEVNLTDVLNERVCAGQPIYVVGPLDEMHAKLHVAMVNRLMVDTCLPVTVIHTSK